jgi:hypothetical protein
MYTSDPTAQITKVANGYVVELGSVAPQIGYVEERPSYEQQVAAQVKIITAAAKAARKDMDKDNLGLPAEEEEKPIAQNTQKPQYESRVHIFRTWEEVAEFLEYHFEK